MLRDLSDAGKFIQDRIVMSLSTCFVRSKKPNVQRRNPNRVVRSFASAIFSRVRKRRMPVGNRVSDNRHFRRRALRQELCPARAHNDIFLVYHHQPVAVAKRWFQRQHHVFLKHRVVECGM